MRLKATGPSSGGKIAPSIKQKVKVSSNVRLQVGQLFISSIAGTEFENRHVELRNGAIFVRRYGAQNANLLAG